MPKPRGRPKAGCAQRGPRCLRQFLTAVGGCRHAWDYKAGVWVPETEAEAAATAAAQPEAEAKAEAAAEPEAAAEAEAKAE